MFARAGNQIESKVSSIGKAGSKFVPEAGAFIGAIWVAPAAAELVSGSFFWPALAGGAAYYFGGPDSMSLIRGYVVGGVIYSYHLYQLALQAEAELKTEVSTDVSWVKKNALSMMDPSKFDQATKDEINSALLVAGSWYEAIQDMNGN
jgi:hypothetical protein